VQSELLALERRHLDLETGTIIPYLFPFLTGRRRKRRRAAAYSSRV